MQSEKEDHKQAGIPQVYTETFYSQMMIRVKIQNSQDSGYNSMVKHICMYKALDLISVGERGKKADTERQINKEGKD